MGLRTVLHGNAESTVKSENKAESREPYSSYKINKARADLRAAHKKVDAAIGKRDLLIDQRENAKKDQEKAQKVLGTFDLVQILLDKTSAFARQQAKGRLEEIVSEALNVVFGGKHRFIMQLETRSSRPEVDYFLDDGETITQLRKPDFDNGGGIVDVVSLALRLGVAELEGAPGPLLMDEVGKHVSAEYSEHVAYFLKEYSNTFGRQIILITHNKALAEVGDLNLEVTKVNGVSKVKVIGGEF